MERWQQKARLALDGIKMEYDFPMTQLTTFKIGGPVDLLAMPENVDELGRVISFCREEKLPWMTIGLGSNLIIRDKGIRGVVIKLAGDFLSWRIDGTQVTAGAGGGLADLAKDTAGHGLTGLEFACGIPGSIGGAVFMNAGAYEGEISQVLSEVRAYDLEQGIVRYKAAELEFGYRKSLFQQKQQVILELVFNLQQGEAESVLSKIATLTCQRESKQPLEMPSAGSVFRRPEGYFVGPLIEAAGLKGYSMGGAQVSTKHAGFIVNTGGATAQNVLDLINHVQKVIKEKNGVDLIPEIKVMGEE